jgi:hypothetical protein
MFVRSRLFQTEDMVAWGYFKYKKGKAAAYVYVKIVSTYSLHVNESWVASVFLNYSTTAYIGGY